MKLKKMTAVLAAILLMGVNTLPAEALTLPEESAASSAAQIDADLMEPVMPDYETRYVTEGALTFQIYELDDESFAHVFSCDREAVSVEIPAEVEGVPVTAFYSGNPFSRCTALQEITTAEGQAYFKSIDGVLFNASGTMLMAYPSAKGERYDVPAGTKTIGISAFYAPEGSDFLKEVTLPEDLEEIKSYAFANQNGLTEIILPDRCTNVWRDSFMDCKGLEHIHFGKNLFTATAAFTGCTSLKTLTGNPSRFTIVDNVLYQGIALCLYPAAREGKSYTVKEGTESISEEAFRNCEALEKVILPDSLKRISDTFYDMPNLKSLTIPEGVTNVGSILNNCDSLETLYLPSTLTNTGYMMLSGCGALTDVYFGGTQEQYLAVSNLSTNTRIRTGNILVHFGDEEEYTTGEQDGFIYKKFADHVQIIRYDYIYEGEMLAVEIPEEIEGVPVTSIGIDAFRGKNHLESVYIPDTVTEICANAFQSCKGLTEIRLPAGLKKLGNNALNGCTGITELDIPSGMTEVGTRVFADMGLIEVTIPEGTETVWAYAFSQCESLETVHLPDGVTTIGDDAFYWCRALKNIELPDSVTTLGRYAFAGTGLTSFDLEGIQSLGNSCFSGCLNLTEIEIPESIRYLPFGVFEQTGLLEIIIPETVEQIDDNAFYMCMYLHDVTILNPHCDIAMTDTTICNDAYDLPSGGCIIEMEYLCRAKIHGWRNSTAEEFANTVNRLDDIFVPLDEESETSAIRGDVDGNGTVDLLDVILLNKNIMIGTSLSEQGMRNADVDDSGKVDAVDSLMILKYVVKILDTL